MDGCQWYILEAYVRNIFCTKIKNQKEYKGALRKTPSKRLLRPHTILNLSLLCFLLIPNLRHYADEHKRIFPCLGDLMEDIRGDIGR